jgi:caa(3)-type oxidase subunit IV
VDLPVSGAVFIVIEGYMEHSDPAAIKKSVRTYLTIGAALYVFTVITVAVNQVHLAVPLAVTVALIIATFKGSMVAAVFMHLNHEKKWIYASLILTVAFFLVLMAVPILTLGDGIGTPIHSAAAPHGAAEGH